MKQVIVIRKDLEMPTGKACAQAAHASEKVCYEGLTNPEKAYDFQIEHREWRNTGSTKICLAVNSYEELKEIEAKANELGIINSGIIMDEGRTVFNSEGLTPTCIAIGPAQSFDVDKVTKALRLY